MATNDSTRHADLKARICVESDGGYRPITDVELAVLNVLGGTAIESAVDRIRDALRYTEICAAALEPGGYTDARIEVQRTLGLDLQGALNDALVSLGARVVDELGVYTDTEGGQAAERAS